MRKNLISLGMLDSKGRRFSSSNGVLQVLKGKTLTLEGEKINNLYSLAGDVLTSGVQAKHHSNSMVCIDAHARGLESLDIAYSPIQAKVQMKLEF